MRGTQLSKGLQDLRIVGETVKLSFLKHNAVIILPKARKIDGNMNLRNIDITPEIFATLPLDKSLFGSESKLCKIKYFPNGVITDVIPDGSNGSGYLSSEQRHHLRTKAEQYMRNLDRIEKEHLFFKIPDGVNYLRVFDGKRLPWWKKIKFNGANILSIPQDYENSDRFEIRLGIKENGDFSEEGYKTRVLEERFAESLKRRLDERGFEKPTGRAFYGSVYEHWRNTGKEE